MLQLFSSLSELTRLTGRAKTPFFPSLGEIRRVRCGSKASRFFRLIFEHKSLKRLFGANLALAFFVSSFLPSGRFKTVEVEEISVQESETPFTTVKVVQYPLEKMSVSQGFSRYHPGVDLAAPYGEPVRPIRPGVVIMAGFSSLGYGRVVIVDHGGGMTSLYAHLSKVLVRVNQEVNSEKLIGNVGATGHASGSHLHLEIRKDGVAINPFSVLPLLLASN